MADAEKKTMKFGYWKIRGLAQPFRMACALGGVDYEEASYEAFPKVDEEGKMNGWDVTQWSSVKHELGMDLPNLPYLIESDGSSFSESQAVLTYACTKAGLTKEYNEVEKAQALALCLEVQDIRNKAVGLFYGKKWDDDWSEDGVCGSYASGAKKQFARLEKILGKRKEVKGGLIEKAGFCAADIHLAEMVYQHMLLRAEILAGCPKLKEFTKEFFAQEAIKEVEAKAAENKLCINNKMANWGHEYLKAPEF